MQIDGVGWLENEVIGPCNGSHRSAGRCGLRGAQPDLLKVMPPLTRLDSQCMSTALTEGDRQWHIGVRRVWAATGPEVSKRGGVSPVSKTVGTVIGSQAGGIDVLIELKPRGIRRNRPIQVFAAHPDVIGYAGIRLKLKLRIIHWIGQSS